MRSPYMKMRRAVPVLALLTALAPSAALLVPTATMKIPATPVLGLRTAPPVMRGEAGQEESDLQ
jgi:hypothetical protein